MTYSLINKTLLLFLCHILVLAQYVVAADRSIDELLKAARTGAVAARIKAIDEVGSQRDDAAPAVNALTELLKDSSADVRAHAAYALGEIGAAAKSAAASLTSLLKDEDQTVRQQGVKAIVAIRPGPQVMIPLFVNLLDDPDAAVRQRILHAVSEAGPEAVPGLIEGLKNDKAVYWACIILRDIGPEAKDAVPALTGLLKNSRPEVRREAALALGAMRTDADSAIAPLALLLDDAESQEAATLALGQIGHIPRTAESKLRANAKSSNRVLSTLSLWTLVRIYPSHPELAKEAAERFISLLNDQDPFVRATAAKALAATKLNPDITFPIYERVLANADEETTRLALDSLVPQGARAIPRLIYALKRDSLRLPAIHVLGRMGPEAASAAGPLAKFVADKNSKVATEAAMALGNIGPAAQTSIPNLVEALESPECDSAYAIIYALGKFGPAATPVRSILLKRLSDPFLAPISAWALLQIDGSSTDTATAVTPVLMASLNSPSAEIRQLAAESFGNFKTPPQGALLPLEKAAQDSNLSVRNAATEALRNLRGQGATKPQR